MHFGGSLPRAEEVKKKERQPDRRKKERKRDGEESPWSLDFDNDTPPPDEDEE